MLRLLPFLLFLLFAFQAMARSQILIVGSSTLYPMITIAAEEFADKTDYKTPIVIASGTGGGFKTFCKGASEKYPDIVNASRAMTAEERALCFKQGILDITEIPIGFDGIVLAALQSVPRFSLTRQQLFYALARDLPKGRKMEKNPNKLWSDIDPAFPRLPIKVLMPPTSSGTRDAFIELVMRKACMQKPEFTTLYPSPQKRQEVCGRLRFDGTIQMMSEDDERTTDIIESHPGAIGVMGFAIFEQHKETLSPLIIEGVEPSYATIHHLQYPLSRTLYLYIKEQHKKIVPGLSEFVQEIMSKDASGPDGYLTEMGLIPRP